MREKGGEQEKQRMGVVDRRSDRYISMQRNTYTQEGKWGVEEVYIFYALEYRHCRCTLKMKRNKKFNSIWWVVLSFQRQGKWNREGEIDLNEKELHLKEKRNQKYTQRRNHERKVYASCAGCCGSRAMSEMNEASVRMHAL